MTRPYVRVTIEGSDGESVRRESFVYWQDTGVFQSDSVPYPRRIPTQEPMAETIKKTFCEFIELVQNCEKGH